MKSVEDDLVARHFSEKVREHIDGHLLAGAAPIAEAERGAEASIVADRSFGFPSDTANTVPKPLLVMLVLRPSLTGSVVMSNGQRGSPISLAFRIIDFGAGRHVQVACRVEALGLLPQPRVEARLGMGRIHVRVPLVGHAELGERRAAVEGQGPRVRDRRDAAAVGRDGSKELQPPEAQAAYRALPFALSKSPVHRLLEGRPHRVGSRRHFR